MKIGIATLTALVVLGLSLGQAAEAEWIKNRGEWSAAERRSMELQENADPKDLEVEGDYGRDPEEWRRNWRRIQRQWRFQEEDIAWGDKKRPVRSRIVILDPPLKKTVGPDKVEVEWFHSHLDEQGHWKVWVQTWLVVARWALSIRKAEIPVEIRFRPVGKGPTWLRRYNGQRRAYQELLYAWKEDASQSGKAKDVLVELLYSREKVEEIVARSTAEKIVEQAGNSVEDWRRLAGSERTQGRIEEANERFRELMVRGSAENKKVLKTPQDPILLIDGKYLLMSSVTGRVRDLFRMANSLIEKQIDRLPPDPSHVQIEELEQMNWKELVYGMEDGAKPEGVIDLGPRLETAEEGKIRVEWFYSYSGRLGREIERMVRGWKAGFTENVELIESPIATRHTGDFETERHHQRLLVAGRPVRWEDTIRYHLRTRLSEEGYSGRITTMTELDEFLRQLKMPMEEYQQGLNHPSTQTRLKGINHRFKAVEEAVGLLGGDDPVLLVNGRYLIVGSKFETLEQTFRTANVFIRKELEAAK